MRLPFIGRRAVKKTRRVMTDRPNADVTSIYSEEMMRQTKMTNVG